MAQYSSPLKTTVIILEAKTMTATTSKNNWNFKWYRSRLSQSDN